MQKEEEHAMLGEVGREVRRGENGREGKTAGEEGQIECKGRIIYV